jgi:Protein of unknown function (DUF3093)
VRSYDERLRPPAWLWVVATVVVLSFGVSFLAALGPGWGLAVVVVLGGLSARVLAGSAAPVRVDDDVLTAGRARIEVRHLGPVEVLDADRARAVRGPESDPAGYHLIRGWVPAGVKAAVLDPDDATPYWFVATRHPAALAAAIDRARGSRPAR